MRAVTRRLRRIDWPTAVYATLFVATALFLAYVAGYAHAYYTHVK